MDILVSVVMPVYNEEGYLRECLDGLVNQTLKDIEVICVDDGSTDDSVAILKEYAAGDNRFKVLQQENQGAGIARNLGLKEAKGRYVIFLDSDDIFEPSMLETMYRAAEERHTDVLVCRCDRYDDATGEHTYYPWSVRENLLPSAKTFASSEIGRDFFKAFIWWPWDKLYRRSFVQGLGIGFQGLRTTNDLFFVAASMLKAGCISYVGNVLIHHRVNMGGSLSVTREKSWDCFYKALKAVRDFMEKEGLFAEREQDFVNYCVHFCLWQLENMKGESRTQLARHLYKTGWQELGIAGKTSSYFYHQNEYDKLRGLIRAEANEEIKAQEKHQEFPIKVSLILPSLNVHEYMEECLESAVNQTLQDIEIICVDAGSTDGTLEIIQDYVSRDSRVKLIQSDKKSYGYQMNIAIDSAQGEYIGILETDDFAPAEMYEELYNTAIENEAELVKADFYRFTRDSEGVTHKTLYQVTKGDKSYCNRVIDVAKEKKCFSFEMNTWSGIYLRSFLEKNNIRHNETPGASFQDNGFWFQTMMYARRAYFVNKPYYMNRRDNPNSSVYNASKIYCICDEYDYLGELLSKDSVLFDEFKGVYACAAFRNYRWTLDRIPMKDKPVFYKRLVALCQNFTQRHMVDYKLLFEQNEMLAMDFYAIVHEPESFFEKLFGRREEILAKLAGAEEIIIYGAGLMGKNCYEDLAKEGLDEKLLGFAVTGAPEADDFKGVPIRKLEDWAGHEEAEVIIAVKPSLKNEIYENLVCHGFVRTHAYPDSSFVRLTEFEFYKNTFNGSLRQDYVFPFGSVKKGSRVVLYGAHEVGQSYYRQLEATGYAKVVHWLDDKYERHLKMGMPVSAPDELGRVEFDTLVIALGNQKNVREIGLKMLSAGVPLEKIVWMDKKRKTWMQTYKDGILAGSRNNLRTCMDDMKRKMEKKLKELNALSKRMEIAESFILPQLTVALEEKGRVLAEAEVLKNIQEVLLQVDCVARLQLLAQDIFAYPQLEDLLKNLLVEGKLLKLELLDGGKTMPRLGVMKLMENNDISICLIHGEGETIHGELKETLANNHIAVKCIFPDIRVEEAAARKVKYSLVLSGDKFCRCPEGALVNSLAEGMDEYLLGSLGECLKAKLMDAVEQEMME